MIASTNAKQEVIPRAQLSAFPTGPAEDCPMIVDVVTCTGKDDGMPLGPVAECFLLVCQHETPAIRESTFISHPEHATADSFAIGLHLLRSSYEQRKMINVMMFVISGESRPGANSEYGKDRKPPGVV